MTEEPGGWELRRALDELGQQMRAGFAGMNTRLDKAMTTEAFAAAFVAEQRRVDERLKDLADDITAEREQRQRVLAEEKQSRAAGDAAQQALIDKHAANLRWIAAAIILPVVLFVASIYFAARGGL